MWHFEQSKYGETRRQNIKWPTQHGKLRFTQAETTAYNLFIVHGSLYINCIGYTLKVDRRNQFWPLLITNKLLNVNDVKDRHLAPSWLLAVVLSSAFYLKFHYIGTFNCRKIHHIILRMTCHFLAVNIPRYLFAKLAGAGPLLERWLGPYIHILYDVFFARCLLWSLEWTTSLWIYHLIITWTIHCTRYNAGSPAKLFFMDLTISKEVLVTVWAVYSKKQLFVLKTYASVSSNVDLLLNQHGAFISRYLTAKKKAKSKIRNNFPALLC